MNLYSTYLCTRKNFYDSDSWDKLGEKQARPVHKGSLCNVQGHRNPRGAKLVSLKKIYNIKGALIKFCTWALEGLEKGLGKRP